MDDEDKNSTASNSKSVNYTHDDGSSMYTVLNAEIDKNKIKLIAEKELSVINFNSKILQKDLNICNLDRESLKGKYYDKDGNVIYMVGSKYYMFKLNIKELSKIY
ncbi:MAG TPA: hypothetical protein P5295_15330 [Spirochaetota bacterium]|nr:hypothetical protein [Spirochaetota bacterium]